MAVLLGPVMLAMWGVSTLLARSLLEIPFWQAALIGAVLTPTDSVVASSIVTGEPARRNLPRRLRHVLSAESGANDGLALLLVMLPLLVLTRPDGGAGEWLRTVVWKVPAGAVLGGLVGYGAGRLLLWSERHRDIEHTAYLGFTVAMSLLVLGAASLVGTDDILAVFVAGRTFVGAIPPAERIEEEQIQESVNRFFLLPIFVLLGIVLPWHAWHRFGWPLVAFAAAVLALRRLPAVLLLRRGLRPLSGRAPALFLGWFGPLGVTAVYYAALADRRSGDELAWPAASLVVVASIIAHGMTATPFANWYGTVRPRKRERAAH